MLEELYQEAHGIKKLHNTCECVTHLRFYCMLVRHGQGITKLLKAELHAHIVPNQCKQEPPALKDLQYHQHNPAISATTTNKQPSLFIAIISHAE